MKKILYIAACSLLLSACSQQNTEILTGDDLLTIRNTKVPAAEYSGWIATNAASLTKEQVLGDLTYRLTRVPADLLALREAGNQATHEALAEARAHYTDLVYFRLEIIANSHNGELLKKDLQSPQEYNRRVSYAAFGVQNDMSMKIGKDSLACAMCQFERSFDVAPIATFMLAFDADEEIANDNSVTVVFNDQLFNNGIIRFYWNAGEINAYPSLEGTNR